LAEILGHVDARDRPIVSVLVPGQEDAISLTIDTGFNGQLLINAVAIDRFKCESLNVEAPVEFANRECRALPLTRGRIIWFGRPQDVEVWITPAESGRTAAPDEPVGLLGTGLLKPHRLTVDFATRRVVIAEYL
jgi:predicted aspartyl protease